MKRLTITIILVTAALLMIAATSAAPQPGHAFLGRWHGTDPYDQSNQTLVIEADGWSGGRLLHLLGSDDRTGPWCGGLARMESLAMPDGENTLLTTGTWWCVDPGGSPFPFGGTGILTYDPATDTISDGTVTYYRGG